MAFPVLRALAPHLNCIGFCSNVSFAAPCTGVFGCCVPPYFLPVLRLRSRLYFACFISSSYAFAVSSLNNESCLFAQRFLVIRKHVLNKQSAFGLELSKREPRVAVQ